MKKLVLLLILFTIIKQGYTQDTTKTKKPDMVKTSNPVTTPSEREHNKNFKNLKIGMRVAPGFTWIKPNSDNLSKQGSRLGFSYGLVTEYYFTENYGIATGIDVSYSGGKLQDNEVSLGYTNDIKYKLQYIEIPFTLKMKTKEYGLISYFGQFGLGASYNLKTKADYTYTVSRTYTGPPLKDMTNENVTGDDIRMFRASFIIAVGGEYSLTGNTKALVSLGFNNGLSNILKYKNKDINNKSIKYKGINNYISLNVGILF